jgi:NAD+ synthase (glutamine-hydrolysing)
MADLSVSCWPFTAGADPRANAERVRAGLAAAQAAGVRLLLTPECCLTGYPSAARPNLDGLDWRLVNDLEDQLARHAERLGLALVLGTAGVHGGGIANQALACGVVAPKRYHKRCLTPTDVHHFATGTEATAFELDGWRLGLAICYDLRFGDVFIDLAAAGVDAYLVIAHMAGPDPDPGTKAAVIPQFAAVRAAETATPLVLCNTAAADRYVDSGAWDARGMRLASGCEGLVCATLRKRETFDPWYAGLRATTLARWRVSSSPRRP